MMKDDQSKKARIEEAEIPASRVPEGSCGYYGNCGATVGTGISISLITDSTPLFDDKWRHCNLMTSRSLLSIADYGEPWEDTFRNSHYGPLKR
jgi:hypothetical protein